MVLIWCGSLVNCEAEGRRRGGRGGRGGGLASWASANRVNT